MQRGGAEESPLMILDLYKDTHKWGYHSLPSWLVQSSFKNHKEFF